MIYNHIITYIPTVLLIQSNQMEISFYVIDEFNDEKGKRPTKN